MLIYVPKKDGHIYKQSYQISSNIWLHFICPPGHWRKILIEFLGLLFIRLEICQFLSWLNFFFIAENNKIKTQKRKNTRKKTNKNTNEQTKKNNKNLL